MRLRGHRRSSIKAFLIPANSSEPVREIDFDHDRSWRYVITRYNDPDVPPWFANELALLTKENAPRDYLLRNSRASEYIKNHLSPCGRADGLDAHENLYGDVVVLGWDTELEWLTDIPNYIVTEDLEHPLKQIMGIRQHDADDPLVPNPWKTHDQDPDVLQDPVTQIVGIDPDDLEDPVVPNPWKTHGQNPGIPRRVRQPDRDRGSPDIGVFGP